MGFRCILSARRQTGDENKENHQLGDMFNDVTPNL